MNCRSRIRSLKASGCSYSDSQLLGAASCGDTAEAAIVPMPPSRPSLYHLKPPPPFETEEAGGVRTRHADPSRVQACSAKLSNNGSPPTQRFRVNKGLINAAKLSGATLVDIHGWLQPFENATEVSSDEAHPQGWPAILDAALFVDRRNRVRAERETTTVKWRSR